MPLQEYIGTKWIEAAPMNREDYEKCRSVISSMVQNEECSSGEGYIIHYFDGYISWSPKDVFESVYRESGRMTFGHALEHLKLGSRVRRKGWNGKEMFLFIASGNDLTCCICERDMPPCSDSIWMKTADDQLVPWTASQSDLLAEDWEIAD